MPKCQNAKVFPDHQGNHRKKNQYKKKESRQQIIELFTPKRHLLTEEQKFLMLQD